MDQPSRSDWPAGDNGCASSFIRRKARQIIRRANLPTTDQEDCEQDLALALWRSTSKFDPDRGPWPAFASTVATRASTKIVRKRRTKVTVSLSSTPIGTDEELAAQLPIDQLDSRTGRTSISDQARTELSIEIESVMESFPSQWKVMLESRAIKPMSEVAREMGVPRSTLNGWMKQVRSRFESEGLRKYFEK